MIDPLSDKRFDRFDNSDRQFLARFFTAHPKVADNFNRYLSLPPMLRPNFAKSDLHDIPRKGWVLRGIEVPESVFQHSISMAQLLQSVMTRASAILAIPDDIATPMIQHAYHMAKVHDMIEVIATDFTPLDPVSSEDKHRVEMLAARVIFEDPKYGKGLALSEEYMEQKTGASHIVHDFDKMHAVFMAAYFENRFPEKAGLYQEFRSYAEPRLKTELGKNYLKQFDAHKDEMLAEFNQAKGRSAG